MIATRMIKNNIILFFINFLCQKVKILLKLTGEKIKIVFTLLYQHDYHDP
jgi:hypothetical protein